MNSKILWLCAWVAIASAMAFIGCQKKDDHRHAPVCPYGQVLSREQGNWTCRYISFNNNQWGGWPQQNPQQQQFQNGVLTPPISDCNYGAQTTSVRQTLVSWTDIGLWTCVFDDLLRPGGGDSPVSPVSRGGESCSLGYGGNWGQQQWGQQQWGGQQWNQYGMSSVSCATGFSCQMAQNTNQQQQQYWNPGYGQLGICQAGYQNPFYNNGWNQQGYQFPSPTPIPR